MAAWDTSALVKLYLIEPDSAAFESVALGSHVAIGMVARHELRTVFCRREAEGAIAAGGATALYERLSFDIASGVVRLQPENAEVEREFAAVLERCFSQRPPIFIRTSDALHLASARAGAELEFVTADLRQRAAAQLLGFKLLP